MYYFDVYSPDLSHVTQVIAQDIPPIVHEAWSQSSRSSSRQPDDIVFRTRPNTDYIVGRDFNRKYQPSWSWTDFVAPSRNTPIREPSYFYTEPSRSRPYLYTETDSSIYKPRYSSRSNVNGFNSYKSWREPYSYTPSSALSSLSNWQSQREKFQGREFPFRKYRSDFVPHSPHPYLYSNVKYLPNPDWSPNVNFAHKYRKSRYVYDLTEQDSSRSREIERLMREARFRELCKGVYSTSYGDHIMAKVNTGEESTIKKAGHIPIRKKIEPELDIPSKSLEAETAPSERERQRRSLTLAEKRRRNETLAVGLTNQKLVKSDEEEKPAVTPQPSEPKEELAPEKPIKDDIPKLSLNHEKEDLGNSKVEIPIKKEEAKDEIQSVEVKKSDIEDQPEVAKPAAEPEDNKVEEAAAVASDEVEPQCEAEAVQEPSSTEAPPPEAIEPPTENQSAEDLRVEMEAEIVESAAEVKKEVTEPPVEQDQSQEQEAEAAEAVPQAPPAEEEPAVEATTDEVAADSVEKEEEVTQQENNDTAEEDAGPEEAEGTQVITVEVGAITITEVEDTEQAENKEVNDEAEVNSAEVPEDVGEVSKQEPVVESSNLEYGNSNPGEESSTQEPIEEE